MLIGAFIVLITILMFGLMRQKFNFSKCLLYVYGIQLYQGEKFQNIRKRSVKCFRAPKNYYRPQRSCEGYVFTPVCLSTGGGGLPQCMLGYQPPGPDTPLGPDPPGTRHPPQDQATPPGTRHPPKTRYLPHQAPLGPGSPQDQAPPEQASPGDGYCCGRYASSILFIEQNKNCW